jgi:hypothetical protein
MGMPESGELLLRWEAHVALGLLRAASAARQGCILAARDLEGALHFLGALGTRPMLETLAQLLEAHPTRVRWHHPVCDCVSAEEMTLLHLLAGVAECLETGSRCAHWWEVLVPAAMASRVDQAARAWLLALRAAGHRFPLPSQMLASDIAQPAHPLALPTHPRLQ